MGNSPMLSSTSAQLTLGCPKRSALRVRAAHAEPFGAQGQCDAADGDGTFEHAFFPFFQITDHAGPRHRAAGGKRLLIVERGVGFEAKHLDQRTG